MAAVVLVVACGVIPQPLKTYPGPEQPPHATAMIEGARLDVAAVFFACIDRSALERHWGSYDNDARWPDKLAVLPGRHRLAVVYSLLRGKKAWWANLELEVQAGRRYVVTGQPVGDALRLSVMDPIANREVASTATPRMRHTGPLDPCP